MARLRHEHSAGEDRPPVPEKLRRFRIGDWIRPGEGPADASENAAAEFGVELYSRWRDARRAWAELNNYTLHELWRIGHPDD